MCWPPVHPNNDARLASLDEELFEALVQKSSVCFVLGSILAVIELICIERVFAFRLAGVLSNIPPNGNPHADQIEGKRDGRGGAIPSSDQAEQDDYPEAHHGNNGDALLTLRAGGARHVSNESLRITGGVRRPARGHWMISCDAKRRQSVSSWKVILPGIVAARLPLSASPIDPVNNEALTRQE